MNEPVTIRMLLIFMYGCAVVAIISFYVGKWYYSKKPKKICKHCGCIGLYNHHKNCILNKNFN